MSARVARRVVVHGLVQGVFFRQSCRQEAKAAGVTGWVRNEPDGSVSAQFEGSAEAVEAMVRWCRTGPSRAVVTDLEVSKVPLSGATRFDVLR